MEYTSGDAIAGEGETETEFETETETETETDTGYATDCTSDSGDDPVRYCYSMLSRVNLTSFSWCEVCHRQRRQRA